MHFWSTIKSTDVGLLLIRGITGFILTIQHGGITLLNFIRGQQDYPDPLGLGPWVTMGLMGFAEFFCALAVALGFFTRWSVIPLVIGFGVAVFIHHGGDDLPTVEGAFRYFAVFAGLFFTGAGKLSIDGWRQYQKEKRKAAALSQKA